MGNNYPTIAPIADQVAVLPKRLRAPFNLTSTPRNRVSTLQEETFHDMLTLERRRAERSGKPFVLMLIDAAAFIESRTAESVMQSLVPIILTSTRETDLVGWYKKGSVLGVIFTELGLESKTPITDILRSKITSAMHTDLGRRIASKLRLAVHLFPEGHNQNEGLTDFTLYPDLSSGGPKRDLSLIVKRSVDIVGSAALMLLLTPVVAAIALAIKLTSKGPVIFRQERLGQFGKRFKCLKFRTMYANNDPKIHQEYVQRFIAGEADKNPSETGKTEVYKITKDPRVTRVGRFLRKTSLDELPQFWNVLMGQMSLVGPRPPVPYEFEVYDLWHRRRVLELKPGVTGLWQVSGRSRMCFDDMVRLDLRYSQSWSLWLDIKILLATPRAALTGEGAY